MFDPSALCHSLDNLSTEEFGSPIALRRARSLEGPANGLGSKPRSPPRSPSSPPANNNCFNSSHQGAAPYYAGGAYNNSPPPSSLPVPEFSRTSTSPPISPCTSPIKSHSQPPLAEGLSPKCLGSPQPVYNFQPRVLQFDQGHLPSNLSMAYPQGGDLAVLSLELRQLLRIAG